MKTTRIHVSVLAAVAIAAAAGCSREEASTVVKDVRTTIGEAITPELGNPDNTLVVRQAKLKERKRQNTTWTDENIAKHPELYLRQCQEDVTAAIEQYDAVLLSARRLRHENQRIVDNAQGEIKRLTRFIDEAKPVFADETTAYPVTVSGFTFTKEQFVKQLRNAIKERKRLEDSTNPASQRAKIAEARIQQVEKAKEDAQEALRSIEMKIADVKANNALTGVTGIKNNVGGILDRASAIDAGLSLDGVVGLPSASQSDEDFIRSELGL